MFFLNLTAAEFLTLLGALGGLITALYLLDRAKRRKTVSTLRFWVNAGFAEERQARRRMREPWSLILQLVSLLLLLLAVSRMQWGKRAGSEHNHVVLIDTSSWSGAQSAEAGPQTSVLDREKAQVRRYLAALPSKDRVMLVAADSLATPVTSFTEDRQTIEGALARLTPGFSALNIGANLSFAQQAQSWSGAAPGEIVYAGPKLINDAVGSLQYDNLRLLPIGANRENCGIVQLTVQQATDEANSWQALVRIRNYGLKEHTVRLDLRYGGTAFAPRVLTVQPGAETTAEYTFTTRTAGELVASIDPGGSLSSDDRASLFVPRSEILRLAIYTDRPEALRPLLAANPQLNANFFLPSQYVAHPKADAMILDRMTTEVAPELPSIFIDPPKTYSPLAVKNSVTDSLVKWTGKSPLGLGLRAKQLRVPAATVFQTFEGDSAVGSVPEGPVVVARMGDRTHPKSAVIGFDPASGALRFELASPLLFANLLEWLEPSTFQVVDLTAERVGVVNVPLENAKQGQDLQVRDERGRPMPFSRRPKSLQLFVGLPTTVHVVSPEREQIIRLSLPDVAAQIWQLPSTAAVGLPIRATFMPAPVDLWKWLALAAGIGLLAEWLLFSGRRITAKSRKRPVSAKNKAVTDSTRQEEFAAK